MASDSGTSKIIWIWVMLVLAIGFLLYRGYQPTGQTVAIQSLVTPMPRLSNATPAGTTPMLPTLDAQPIQSTYYVINQMRLYCAAITPDLQYTGTPEMQAWWATLVLKMKHWYFDNCQARPLPN